MELRDAISRVVDGAVLSADEAEAVFDAIMRGEASEALMAAFLAAVQTRGPAPTEVAGGVRALRKAMVRVHHPHPDLLVDTAGTGGGAVTTFNISTAAALVAAGAGARVAKHGNRSFTSRCGSADVLEALGVRIDLTPERMAAVLDEAGIVFMFAPALHPAMRHVGPVRRALGIPTIMNLLGPLTNPAGARRQVVGVADPDALDLVADALVELDHIRALVVHGEAGLDEVSPLGPTRVAEVQGGSVRRYTVEPADLGLRPADAEELAGGDPEDNAQRIREVLAGGSGGARTAVVMNAGAALWAAGLAETLEAGARLAERSLDEGRAARALERLRAATHA